jgi:predicted kinase
MGDTLYMTIGLPGAGKDYYVKHLLDSCIHIASDDIRAEVFGDVNDQTHNSEVFQIMFKRTVEALKSGKDVVYNATNLSRKRRMAFLRSIAHVKDVRKVALVFNTPYEVCLERNAKRDRHVPEGVIFDMLKRFDLPDVAEGFDEVAYVGEPDTSEKLYEKFVQPILELSHDNPHHDYSVGRHMNEAYQKAYTLTTDASVLEAAAYHDIGKAMTKAFYDARGNKTEIAHFYNHENVGSYLYISHVNMQDVQHITALLIAHHMDHYKGEAYVKKMAELYGEEFMEKLEQVHKCDEAAH